MLINEFWSFLLTVVGFLESSHHFLCDADVGAAENAAAAA